MAQLNDTDDVDDFFGDDLADAPARNVNLSHDHHDLSRGLFVAESNAVARRFQTMGYHEAYDAHQEDRLQEGFESGYKESFEDSLAIGNMVGRVVMEDILKNSKSISSSKIPCPTSPPSNRTQIALLIRRFLSSSETPKDLGYLRQRVGDMMPDKR